MKTIKYKNFTYSLIWDGSMSVTTYIAHGNINGQYLLVHSATSEEDCIAKMEAKIESEVIAHQI